MSELIGYEQPEKGTLPVQEGTAQEKNGQPQDEADQAQSEPAQEQFDQSSVLEFQVDLSQSGGSVPVKIFQVNAILYICIHRCKYRSI